MIILKGSAEIALMRKAGEIASAALRLGGMHVKPGVTTGELDRLIQSHIEKAGAIPSFLGYGGFPAAACISINDVVIHGIPGRRRLAEGDIVSIDVGARYHGYHGDCAATFPVGEVSQEARKLIEVTRQSFFEGLKFAKRGFRLGDIGHAVQSYVERFGFSVVRSYVGHGVGAALHEEPEVPNFGFAGRGLRLEPGMTIAVEPMVNAGGFEVEVGEDEWTVTTCDHALAAHYENTILITDGEPEILTVRNLEV
ncbi:MAG TPA: type I methionyl aminopeptidase [Terriglobales bacterium]|nr:type I methionyl aminopeptidase [Terriglobales bacterium]